MSIDTQSDLERSETADLIGSDRVQGTTVYNRDGEKIGTVEKVMIDKISGEVAYAVMSFGGFLGMGEKYHPLPWGVLAYDQSKDGYRVSLSKDQLEKAPTYEGDREPDWSDPTWGSRVHDYYGSRL